MCKIIKHVVFIALLRPCLITSFGVILKFILDLNNFDLNNFVPEMQNLSQNNLI